MATTTPRPNQQAEREFTSLLINLYRECPVLWRVRDKDYFNKNKKTAAWDAVLTGLRVYKPNYTIDDVKRKINGLRSNFNREYKAIEAKRRSGEWAEDAEPSLWYYNDIIFIKDQIEVATENSEAQPSQDLQDSSCPQPPLPRTSKTSYKKTKRTDRDPADDLVWPAAKYFKRPSAEEEEDIVAKGWALKLMRMEHDQKRLAERIITDVLLDGEIGSLTWEGMRFVTSQRPWAQPPG